MLLFPCLIAPSAQFWTDAADHLLVFLRDRPAPGGIADFSSSRVLVPTFEQARRLKLALATAVGSAFVPPVITTLSSWLALQVPADNVAGDSERLMALYAELRQHAWLKKLFSARRNTDLLPLAQTLLALSDELTLSLLPAMRVFPQESEQRWQAALDQLSPAARELLSDESQLVWTIWRTQLDQRDANASRLEHLLQLAARGAQSLVWISPVEADPFEQAFLSAYAERHDVLPICLDWRAAALAPVCVTAWPELVDGSAAVDAPAALERIALFPACSLEDEAVRGAQTVLDWIAAGHARIAIIAQDRVIARRLRALLERAEVFVADETGWKLSTTRAASALAALFDVVTSRAETGALLDLLKSPFITVAPASVMTIELALRRANVTGGWEAAALALKALPAEHQLLLRLREQAGRFQRNCSLGDWLATTREVLDALGMQTALSSDSAGEQLMALLDRIALECSGLGQPFSFAEWRAFVGLQCESAAYEVSESDQRVVMLPLNGARLRSFDAVLVVGIDAGHLPSQPPETLFFANAVRRELGLATREIRQRQQLRDLTELLSSGSTIVLSWQATVDGEPNTVSPWIERLQLTLLRAGLPVLPEHRSDIAVQELQPALATMPAPAAPALLPAKLSASAYNSLIACPYQFFATRMLGLNAIDELSDLPEKRDYGDWLHQILAQYHATVSAGQVPLAQRAALLASVSEQIFRQELARNAAALGYYVRWQKVMPAYLHWAAEREEQGWQFVIGEQQMERELCWPGGAIRLHGRVDRIDEHADGTRAVLDYKTKAVQGLRDRFKQTEDHQLPFYGLLADARMSAGHYVALELTGSKTGDVAAPDYALWQDTLEHRIIEQMHAISTGAALPANGIDTVCQYCDVRGLCRKGAWA
ncbi:PD-(D/E)XK nuclease family protein [Actimicrobium sp. CCC2.4]|uniref:PD-(D/E)XK nuclease family protein n=1 Tax=Actimicrobium sp. CCC2.4 TaxID=3048606 RepID=UPI002AC947E8|nr:PD-(D/E)XK nuclease family protein [Actimicrobium sp. CCC2.4]MEB0135806.1 PD-(D/E)XK nuclease family protein [Actimicrobium sp. CCC2.4]WPX33286.1 PD-(D/E)XK nuclease family protein [Actimicrobium sp. CCC2.4]